MQGAQDFSKKAYNDYGIDLSGASNTLATGLFNIFNNPALNSISTIGDALFTNTPPAPQDVENQRNTERGGVHNGDGPGADNGSPSTTTPASSAEDRTKQITDYLKNLGYSDDLIS